MENQVMVVRDFLVKLELSGRSGGVVDMFSEVEVAPIDGVSRGRQRLESMQQVSQLLVLHGDTLVLVPAPFADVKP